MDTEVTRRIDGATDKELRAVWHSAYGSYEGITSDGGRRTLRLYADRPEVSAAVLALVPIRTRTPLADALALVDQAQGNDVESDRRLVALSFTDAATARELAALRELAETVRVQLLAHPES